MTKEEYKTLLEEAVEWLCVHSEVDKTKVGRGYRQWCSHCNNYIKYLPELTLVQRIREALEEEEAESTVKEYYRLLRVKK